MRRIDCHILVDPQRPATGIVEQLRREAINLWVLPAQPGALTKARIEALQLGHAPYVCWVDDDDEITPHIMNRLKVELDAHPEACGVFSSEAHVDHLGKLLRICPHGHERAHLSPMGSAMGWSLQTMLEQHPLVHHVALFRREHALRYLETIRAYPRVGDQLLLWLVAQHGPWRHVPIVGYRWKRWPGQITRQTDLATELNQAKAYARKILLPGF